MKHHLTAKGNKRAAVRKESLDGTGKNPSMSIAPQWSNWEQNFPKVLIWEIICNDCLHLLHCLNERRPLLLFENCNADCEPNFANVVM